MVELYCRDHHAPSSADPGGLCPDCAALLGYARARLARCPYAAGKPTCAKCPTHCYRPAMREQVRSVMRYSGPRMLTKHPLLAAAHLIDGRRIRPTL
jgi:predicted amidophosphoribosyltransferase